MTDSVTCLQRTTGLANMDQNVLNRYLNLEQRGKIQAEYVWIDAVGQVRGKTRTMDASKAKSVADLPDWNFDGSSTDQAPGDDSEVIIKPVASWPDPFRPGNGNILVLCETFDPSGTPIPTNKRNAAAKVFAETESAEPWFGLEQEYTLFNLDQTTPLGWPKGGYPKPQGPYYCGVGADASFGRAIPEAHYRACLYAGLTISGVNAEVMPGQWEYQIGPATGINAADEIWISRYILNRVCEDFGVIVTLHPKPVAGDWNGAGMHINFSTKKMRQPGGMAHIITAIDRLGAKHSEHMYVYGEDNRERMTGAHETASYDEFSYGVANRGCSVRISRETEAKGYGYFEDRRPASNVDPYVATGKIMHTISEDVTVPKAVRKDKEVKIEPPVNA